MACTTSKTTCHLFCRECALSNLVAQKKEIKRVEKERERHKVDNAEEVEARKALEDEQAVRDFEAVQMGLERKYGDQGGSGKIVGREGGKVFVEQRSQGQKRRLELDEAELATLGQDQQSKRSRASANLQAEAKANYGVPTFWIPSSTPFTKAGEIKVTKLHPVCPASEEGAAHELNLKTLVSVQFREDEVANASNGREMVRSCPACNKSLSNSTKAVLAKPCGHVVCKPCAAKFMKPSEKDAHDSEAKVGVVTCYVCQADITQRKREKKDSKVENPKDKDKDKEKISPGLVEISTEGTGFASGGKNMVKKKGVAFQC